jgi:hypothetical protein
VALLAASFGVPFAHLALERDRAHALGLVGRRVVLRADDVLGACTVRVIDVEDRLDPDTVASILALKQESPLSLTPVERLGAYSAPTTGLALSDIRFFGGKAVNFGMLRRAIPASSPRSTAFSFDLWDGFLDQQLASGVTLRQEIGRRLGGQSYPPEMQALAAALRGVQELIRDSSRTVFDATPSAAVLATLQDPQYGFDPARNLRFRSSTNVEDAEQFIGAGLYESFSGCLADDLDAGAGGTSLCDPSEPSERGVFRAIRKVFASFYNLNAYLERLRRGLDESQVGMALVVHHSFPDSDELANGVATLKQLPSDAWRTIHLVSQLGADSVTNPIAGQIAEEVTLTVHDSAGDHLVGPPQVLRRSNLVQLGATVLDEPGDYRALARLMARVSDEYRRASGHAEFTLEFEYKKIAPEGALVVKQVRRIPEGDTTPSVTPFLIGESMDYCLLSREEGNLFADHRLDARFRIETRSLWLSPENLETSIFDGAALDYHDGCRLRHHAGSLASWPEATHGFASEGLHAAVSESWTFTGNGGRRRYRLTLGEIPLLVSRSESPLLTLGDLGSYAYAAPSKGPGDVVRDRGCFELRADYDHAVAGALNDVAKFCPCSPPSATEAFEWVIPLTDTNGVRIETTLGATPRATITGLTSTPIVLTTHWSQSFQAGHHFLGLNFLFEPALEPGLPRRQRDQLAAASIRAIQVIHDPAYGNSSFTYYDDLEWGGACPGLRERPLDPLRRAPTAGR